VASRFWVGGTGTWDGATTTNWSATSGGAGGASAPTSADDVFFDGNSGTGTATATSAAAAKSVTCTGYTGTLTGGSITVSGNITLASTMTAGASLAFAMVATGTITSAGKTIAGGFNISGSGITCTQADAINCGSGTLTLTQGTWNTGNFSVTAGVFSSNNSNTRTLTLGSSSIALTASGVSWNTAANGMTVTANTATVTLSGAGAFFTTSGISTWNGLSVVFSGSGTATMNPASTCTFANVTRAGTAVKTDVFTLGGTTTTVTVTGTLTLGGNSTKGVNRLRVRSSTAGTQQTFACASAAVVINGDVDFMDINISGSPSWTNSGAAYIGDCGGNAGVITANVTASAGQTWSGTSGGNWSTNAWTSRVPLPQDDVTIASAFIASQTVTADMPNLGRNITWSGATGTPTWSFASIAVSSYGNITLISGMSFTGTNAWTLAGRGAQTWTNGGQSGASCPFGVVAPGGSYTLQDTLSSSHTFTVTAGTFNASGFSVSCFAFVSTGSLTRTASMGGAAWTVSNNGGTGWNTTSTGLTLSVSTTTVSFTGTSGATTISTGGVTMPNITFNGAGGSWTQNDAITTAGTITLTAGTWATGGFSVTAAVVNGSNSNTRTITMGSSTITLSGANQTAWNFGTVTGLTTTTNTAVIVLTGTAAIFSHPANLAGASLVLSGSGAPGTGSGWTLANLVRVGTAVKTDSYSVQGNGTVTGTIAFQGNSATNRLLAQSNTIGTQRTITDTGASWTASVTLAGTAYQTANVDVMDVKSSTGSVDLSGISGGSGDCQGNSGITFTSGTTQTNTGATGNWSDSSKWTSRVPLPQDTVVVNTGTGTITADMPRLGKDISFTGFTGTASFSSTGNSGFGNWTFGSGMSASGTQNLTLSGRGTQTITSAGIVFANAVLSNPIGGSCTLQDALRTGVSGDFLVNFNLSGTITGGFTTGGFTITCRGFGFGGTGTMAPTSSNFVLASGANTATPWNMGTGATFGSHTGTISYNSATTTSFNFSGAGKTYGTLQYTVASSPGAMILLGANTFTNLTVTAYANDPKVLTFPSSTTTTVTGTLSLNGVQQSGYVYLPGVAGSFVSTPNAAWNQITGDIDLRAQIAMASWSPSANQVIIARSGSGTNSLQVFVDTSGKLNISISGVGTATSSAATGLGAGVTRWIRATYATATGQAIFYTSSDGSTWTQLGSNQNVGASGAIAAGTNPLTLGANSLGTAQMTGSIYKAQIYSGIGGTLVGSYDATAANANNGQLRSYADSVSGATWTVNGAANSSVLVNSSTPATAGTISVPGTGTVTVGYTAIQDSTATGGATFVSYESIRISNDTGWIPGWLATVALTASAGMTAAGATLEVAAAALAGTASESASGSTLELASAALTGTAALTADSLVNELASVALAGTAALTADGSVTELASVNLSGSASVTAAGSVIEAASAALSGTASASASGSTIELASSSLSALAALAVDGSVIELASASMAGTAALTVSGATNELGSASLTGSASMSTDGSAVQAAAAALSGSAVLNFSAFVQEVGSAAMAASAALTADSFVTELASVALTGDSTLTVDSSVIVFAGAGLSATASMDVPAVVIVYASAALVAAAGLTVSGVPVKIGAAALAGVAAMVVAGITYPTPAERIFHVSVDSRVLVIPAETRALAIPAESRLLEVVR
jgi:hypothetical protein